MNHLKSYKLFESEIPWSKFERFIFDVQDVFTEIMDNNINIGVDDDKYSFEYQDDFIFLKFDKTNVNDIMTLWEDIRIALNRLEDNYDITYKTSDLPERIKIVITLQS